MLRACDAAHVTRYSHGEKGFGVAGSRCQRQILPRARAWSDLQARLGSGRGQAPAGPGRALDGVGAPRVRTPWEVAASASSDEDDAPPLDSPQQRAGARRGGGGERRQKRRGLIDPANPRYRAW